MVVLDACCDGIPVRPDDQLKPVENVPAWNMPGGPNAITGQTAVHIDDGLLGASDPRDSIIRFLELSMKQMNGKQSRDQLRTYRQLRTARLSTLGVDVTAAEASTDAGVMMIWPTTAPSEVPGPVPSCRRPCTPIHAASTVRP